MRGIKYIKSDSLYLENPTEEYRNKPKFNKKDRKQYDKEYREKNKERLKAQRKEYYRKNIEKIKEYHKEYYRKRSDK